MHYGNIKFNDIADGEGVRVSLFVSGCTNHCEGCFQPETWNFSYGDEYTEETENQLIEALKEPHIQGLTLLGGDPFEIDNQRVLVKLLRRVREELSDKDVWAYTGFIYDKDFVFGGKRHCEVTDEMLSLIDVLVDGPFIQDKKNISLVFRGSENQRFIDLHRTRLENRLILYRE